LKTEGIWTWNIAANNAENKLQGIHRCSKIRAESLLEKRGSAMKTINQSLMLSSFPVWMASFLLPIYCTGLGLTPLETTGMFSVCSLFILLSKWVSGRWCDRIGRKTVFLLGVFLMALSYLLLSFAQ